MRILVLCGDRGIPLLGPSGASAHLRGVCRALIRQGHEVRVAVPLATDHRGAICTFDATQTTFFAPRAWHRWLRERGETWDARKLTQSALSDFRPDLIWERHSLFVDAGLRAARQLDCPRLLEVNAPLSVERPRIRNRVRAQQMELASLRSATGVVAVSSWLQQWCEARGAARTLHLPNGTERASPTHARRREAIRSDLGVSGTLVGFVGSCRPWHGLHQLPQILDAAPELQALVVGDGPSPPPAHPRLHHVGRQAPDQLDGWLSAMDVGIDLRTQDAPPWLCPLKIADYRATGLPVVSRTCDEARILAEGAWFPVTGPEPQAWVHSIRQAAQAQREPQNRSWDVVVNEALAWLG